ncbi:MAG: hypothetical protein AAGF60_00645 [Pseudomonadota bacterium]
MSNNKVLTVSYGTFSCTLEGFEDSFGTMKVIAEYFRDLAADDRYFGAEPPQPDADLLARIAEKEIARRVDAHEDQGRIVLSAAAAPAVQPAEPVAEDAAPAPVVDEAAVEAISNEAPEGAEETVVADAEVAEPTIDAVEETVDVALDADVIGEATVQTDAEGDLEPVAEDVEAPAVTEIAEPDIADAQADDPIDAEDSDVPASAAPQVAAAALGTGSSIADKLERIRAVVSQKEAEDAAYIEDEHAEDVMSEPAVHGADTSVVADAAAEMEAALDADDAALAALGDTPADRAAVAENASIEGDEDTDTDAALDDAVADDLSESADAAVATSEDALADEDDAAAGEGETPALASAQDDDDDIAAILARLDADDRAPTTPAAEAPEPQLPDTDPAAAEDMPTTEAGIGAAEDIPAAETEARPEETVQAPPAARVIKVKRADLEAAISSGALEEVTPEPEPIASTLSDDDEADLMRELAAVEAEMEGGIAPAPAEPDVDRLMAEADAQMDEPEAARNRDAFAHLRAAVAAKSADHGIGEDDDETEGRFRTDLNSVVKPRRPEGNKSEGRAARPVQRAAPLKLVAEQRVDTPKDGPVRPRRIASSAPASEADADGNFVDYAEDMGAESLPQLLEAAAAYLAFVENRDTFSRPQIMNRVKLARGTEFSREDGLRSFGQLLRAGKIEKLKGGRFAATGEIGFRRGARAAG